MSKFAEWIQSRKMNKIRISRRVRVTRAKDALHECTPAEACDAFAQYCDEKIKEIDSIIASSEIAANETYKMVIKGLQIAQETAEHNQEQFEEVEDALREQIIEEGIGFLDDFAHYDPYAMGLEFDYLEKLKQDLYDEEQDKKRARRAS